MHDLNFSITSKLSPEILELKKSAFKSNLLNEKAALIDNQSRHVVVRNGNNVLGALTVSQAHETLQIWSRGNIEAKINELFISRAFVLKDPNYSMRTILKLLVLNTLNFNKRQNFITSARPHRTGIREVLESLGFSEYLSMKSYHSEETKPVELILFKLENYNLDFEKKNSEILSNIQPAF